MSSTTRSDIRHSTMLRGLLLLSSAAVIWMNARALGAEGQGFVALFGLGMLTISAAGAFIAGGAVVYLQQRVDLRLVWWPGMLWLAAVAAGVGALAWRMNWLPRLWLPEICLAGFLQGAIIFHAQLGLACKRVKLHNWLTSGQTALLALILLPTYFGVGWQTPDAWATCLEITLVLMFFASLSVFRGLGAPVLRLDRTAMGLLWHYGRFAASGGLLQMWTNRANISLLERASSTGLTGAGVYAVAYYGLEAIWSFSRGLAPVLHSRIAGMSSGEGGSAQRQLTLRFARMTMLITSPLAVLAVVLPDSLYAWVFGFPGIAPVLRGLFPLMLTGALCGVLAHHLSGIGAHKWNAGTSAAGLLALLLTAPFAIEAWGATGAAVAASFAGIVQLAGLIVGFRRTTNVRPAP